MIRTHAYTQPELKKMFPNGVPLSALLIVERSELKPTAKNQIIDVLAKEHNPTPATRYQAAMKHAGIVANLARKAAFKEAYEILRAQLLWTNSKMWCSRAELADRAGQRMTTAATKPYKGEGVL